MIRATFDIDQPAPTKAPPAAVPCPVCKQPRDWEWGRQLSGYGWCYPPSHPECERQSKRQEHREACKAASKAAGVPVTMRTYHPARCYIQPEDQDAGTFICRMQARPNSIGVLLINLEDVGRIFEWSPPRWLYIEGQVGRGKSLVAAALANRLSWPSSSEDWVNPDGTPWDPAVDSWRPGHRRRVIAKRWPCHYTDWPEFYSRLNNRSSLDKDPLLQFAQHYVLILDDLPAEMTPAKREAVERLIVARYRDNLPTIFTSNVPWVDAVDARRPTWGHRAASRLAEMCDVAHLRGPDWRNPPDPPKRAEPVGRKTDRNDIQLGLDHDQA